MTEKITWNDIKRSEKPFDYKAALERVAMTPERLNAFLQKEIQKVQEKK